MTGCMRALVLQLSLHRRVAYRTLSGAAATGRGVNQLARADKFMTSECRGCAVLDIPVSPIFSMSTSSRRSPDSTQPLGDFCSQCASYPI